MKKGDLVERDFVTTSDDGEEEVETKQFVVVEANGDALRLLRANRMGIHYESEHPASECRLVRSK